MEELGQKVSRFLELIRARTAVRCVHTLNAATAAARRTNLPAWILDEVRKKYRCSCELLRNAEKFVWDLMQRPECPGEADHASLEELWMLLGARKLGRPFTRREHRERSLSSQRARFERFDVPGLARR